MKNTKSTNENTTRSCQRPFKDELHGEVYRCDNLATQRVNGVWLCDEHANR